ncbi:hypothetical protein BJX68DRAFT_263390 [Aspergillus pseudodeflectus]|uniref:Decapping nuclease n=1 Tax=Aspergillus pseudodeflectus TaxID=176178 RepID=A0ABR4L022_9EURO
MLTIACRAGSPPAWTPVATLKKLPEDSGSYFRDQNAARFAAHVFQPALEAILHDNPEFELNDLDIFACISTLRNLLRFVTDPDQGFRMIVEAIGATVFLVRREASPTEKSLAFLDVKGSESHQRILKYNFAGISCAIRYEGDGYLPNLHRPDTSHVEDPAGDADDLLKPLQHSSVGSVAAEKVAVLAVETAGTAIPQSAMFDLKTRSARKEYTDVLRGELPRLWFAQVPNFIVGFYNRGLFSDVRVKNVQQEVEEWEEEQKPQLKRLAALLRALIAFARGQPSGRFELVFEGGNRELELREVGGQANCCISDELKTRWHGSKSEEAQLEIEKTLDEGGTSGVGEDWDEEEARMSCGWSDDSV